MICWFDWLIDWLFVMNLVFDADIAMQKFSCISLHHFEMLCQYTVIAVP